MMDSWKLQIFVWIAFAMIALPASTALTTFGKTNPQNKNQNPPQPPTQVGKARECKLDTDCGGIQNTSCMADPRDGRMRCLCGDYSAPDNGVCNNKWKAIRAPCNEDAECIHGSHCVPSNITGMGRRCYCMKGYVEENLMCSGAPGILRFHSMALLVLAVLSGNLS